jgi:prepilin-type N-terminal cleavage/methylation domain-containing protein/prepilin-type processing-associated H-X9-DG protein
MKALRAAAHPVTWCSIRQRQARRPGFTLLELLVVVAILAIMASLLLPVLTRTKSQATRVVCLSNFRQLQMAWNLYPDDNAGVLVINSEYWDPTPQNSDYSWVQGFMALDATEEPHGGYSQAEKESSVDTSLLVGPRALFSRYIPAAKLYRCPSDKSTVTVNGQRQDRVRSYCMNQYLGHPFLGFGEFVNYSPPFYHTVGSMSQIDNSRLLVLIEVHEDTIWSPLFYPPDGDNWDWRGFPASRHNGTCVVSFADGHVEVKKWMDARTKRPVTVIHNWLEIDASGSPDVRWVQERIAP